MESKSPLKSKSIWFNVLLIVSSVGTALLADENIKVFLGNHVGWIGTIVGIAGFFLRFYTVDAVEKPKMPTLKKKPTHKDRLEILDPKVQSNDDYIREF